MVQPDPGLFIQSQIFSFDEVEVEVREGLPRGTHRDGGEVYLSSLETIELSIHLEIDLCIIKPAVKNPQTTTDVQKTLVFLVLEM